MRSSPSRRGFCSPFQAPHTPNKDAPLRADRPPDQFAPDERLDELARILANGFLRLRSGDSRSNDSAHFPENTAKTGQQGLEVSAAPRLTVTPRL